MFDDIAAYFHENVVESYITYRNIRKIKEYGLSKDLRSAVIAATALYHLREHLPEGQRKSRKVIANECPDYDVLGDVVNAAKHREIDRGNPKVRSAKDLYEQIVLTEFKDVNGRYTNSDKLVKVRFTDGTERDLYECLTNVINYWGDEFVRMGILDSYRPFEQDPAPGSRFIPRDEAKNLDLELIRGVRFNQNLLFQKFNSESGRSEPIDLSGSKLNFKIYQPAYSVDIQLTHPVTGREYNLSLKLNEDASIKWHTLKTDAERKEFMRQLAEQRDDEIKAKLLELIEAENQSDVKEVQGGS